MKSYYVVAIPVLFIYMLWAVAFGFNPQTWSDECKSFWIFVEIIAAAVCTVVVSEYNRKDS